jgi:hypothetical protein
LVGFRKGGDPFLKEYSKFFLDNHVRVLRTFIVLIRHYSALATVQWREASGADVPLISAVETSHPSKGRMCLWIFLRDPLPGSICKKRFFPFGRTQTTWTAWTRRLNLFGLRLPIKLSA